MFATRRIVENGARVADLPYSVRDELFLWSLVDPSRPLLIGDLLTVRSPRGVSIRYAEEWISHGFALSEDLPLQGGEVFSQEKDTAPGAVDDARPDRWGERVIRFIDRPPRLSLLEYLFFAGDERFGALGVSLSRERYEPRRFGPLPTLADVEAIAELVQKVLAHEPVPAQQKRLIAPGVTMGGARPKALIEDARGQWVVKFADGDPVDTQLIEHATMTLATEAGIRSSPTFPIRLVDGHAVAVLRFDRHQGKRVHALSAHVALRAANEVMGYPELAQVLRRRGIVEGDTNIAQMRELFRRMVFNILIDNTDDHEKNHVLLMNDQQCFSLSPAFDVLPSGQALGYQQMRVGEAAADSTIENALSSCALFSLTKDAAIVETRRVISAVERWQSHFRVSGVSARDIEILAEQIDRPFLVEQRRQL
jgi:serine/threonine-protein kinase HipA